MEVQIKRETDKSEESNFPLLCDVSNIKQEYLSTENIQTDVSKEEHYIDIKIEEVDIEFEGSNVPAEHGACYIKQEYLPLENLPTNVSGEFCIESFDRKETDFSLWKRDGTVFLEPVHKRICHITSECYKDAKFTQSNSVMLESINELTNAQMLRSTDQLIQAKRKPFVCEQCSYRCNRKNNLSIHKLTHTGEKSFACDQCEYKCTMKNSLIRHKLTHTGEKPYACDQCAFTCSLKSSLIRHKFKHIGTKSCDMCTFRCNQSKLLAKHKLTHLGEKSFASDQLDNKYNNESIKERQRRCARESAARRREYIRQQGPEVLAEYLRRNAELKRISRNNRTFETEEQAAERRSKQSKARARQRKNARVSRKNSEAVNCLL